MPAQTTTDNPTTTACWCCGEPRTEDELARLGCHDEVALCDGCVSWLADRLARRRSGAALHRAVPVLPTADLTGALERYRALGFATEPYSGGGYGFVTRDRVELHLGQVERVDPEANLSCCYLYVTDADALHTEWTAAGTTGRLTAPFDTAYGLREGAYADPDGNLVRFGSPSPDPNPFDEGDIISGDDPVALAAGDAIRTGDLDALQGLLEAHAGLATAWIGDASMARTLLHAATDWPGHLPNVAATVRMLVESGADLNAGFIGPHAETPLHWAASSDDVEALDALIDAGADLEAPGAVLGGGSPLADAIGFGQWQVARRLVERGARTRLKDAAALGLMERVEECFAGSSPPGQDEITGALWAACHGGQQPAAEYLLERGADLNWIGWGELTPLDVAAQSEASDLVEWLRSCGAKSAGELT